MFASWLMLLSGGVCWYRHLRPRPPGKPFSRRQLLAIGLLGIALIATGFVVSNVFHHSLGDFFVWPGIALLLFALLSLPREIKSLPADPGSGPELPARPPLLLWVVASVPLLALAIISLPAALVLVLTGLTLIGEIWTPTGAVALLGLRRVPVLTFFAVWFLITSMLNTSDHYHDVRLGPALALDVAPVSVRAALDEWTAAHAPPGGGSGTRQQIPMLFVSASCGGIRAAYWTAMVLNCLFSPAPAQQECAGDPLDRSTVFAESGISGGSLGLVTDRVLVGTGRRYADVLDDDLVSPDAAALAFRDMPISWLRLEPSGIDPAAVLEQAWERAARSLRTRLFADAADASGRLRLPMLPLNGATVY